MYILILVFSLIKDSLDTTMNWMSLKDDKETAKRVFVCDWVFSFILNVIGLGMIVLFHRSLKTIKEFG